jgi:thymidine kinase
MAKLYFYYSAMNAGKSTVLLQSSHNYNERGMDTLLLAPSIDDRGGVGMITTRIGLKRPAIAVKPSEDLFELIGFHLEKNSNIRAVLIDEAQFLTKQQVHQLCQAVDKRRVPILTYGIRTDFQAEPFPGSAALLALADELIEIKTICHCGKKASMNMRIDEKGQVVREGEQVFIGGNESYIATCRACFYKGEGQFQGIDAKMTGFALTENPC